MTSQMTQSPSDAKAAETGANATRYFQKKAKATTGTDQARAAAIIGDALAALHGVIEAHEVTYAEYDVLKAWMIQVGEDGEWPLWLDVFIEHSVESVNNDSRPGSKGTIEGPFYIPGAPQLGSEGTLPMRDGEPGTPFIFRGEVTDADGNALPGATVELWHCDSEGFYSQFAPGLPEWNLRGVFTADESGAFAAHTMMPAPYQIPHDGSTGAMIAAAGWHPWRPAHFHLKVQAPGHELLTTQLYFEADEYLDSDIAGAVKPELMLTPVDRTDGEGKEVSYQFRLCPEA